ncbi:MAG: bifunctional GTP diphosphokinase/guanosine-3',5'-bis pyrophosphate 3'-pyrophosphohydrolase [Paraglaciecola sp.]|uniref:bifunctional GTP diphosphokinase/guanosine-3',5'-bis pyrophosphate 3'-pyrophosphohydrolase n=1 Tax=Pseudomonadati TaxID=3379134 RepID=UPI00273DA00B|nr:bifunctional GTP diphosphokinase/guanosine-3',5'-bis pyrophosphate 3'-pyrophosphohydrolase [Paraglaciecola sp.]MDP5029655.1 bifunctional GTP diphosphokinase/guanosine-3',5'-bis pyrophosphate 3'-pyrophosphohydrolase [Paraglaciecola sp.]MDP5129950.1 bifunctional GTP diphosphokinase/guanosine-3',5'-bis pyrophosphate 3'-pyrophosphohydrolase [Paraglaciecola sp.]
MYLFEGLKQKLESYLPPDRVADIQRAFLLARDAHSGQMRSSGDPYITHPVAVAGILADMRLDYETLMAALLHDVIEDTHHDKDDLSAQFGQTVGELVEGVSKLDKIQFSSTQEAQAENFRKMIMAMVKDIRVILIKLADRTHNMRTLGSLRPDKRRRIARETLEIYAPIAHRLGIHEIKNELEDLGFQAMYPLRYRALKGAVKQARGNRKEVIENTRKEVESRLAAAGIEATTSGREKHLYSIYRKMKNKELMFNEVMDIYAFRVVVESVDHCYRALGAMHGLYKPIESRFKDYIAIPRTNGYQSLHTSLIGPHGIPVEIQIRTLAMDQMADKGVAAHWLYKDSDDVNDTTAQVRARKWMQSLIELQQSASSSFEFIENVKTDLFPDEIYVFTPDGRIIELPMGATAVDFAYAVHTDVGNSCVGVKVERRTFSLSKPLENGQTVEIITSPRAKPNANWLNFVVSARARAHIRHYLKNQRSEEAVIMGNRLLRHALGTVKLDEIPQADINRVVSETKHDNFDALLADIGLGNELSIIVARRLLGDSQHLSDKQLKVAIRGTEGLLVSYSRCCHPIPGDEIVAILSPGKGMVIHQHGCSNIRKLSREEPHRVLVMQWDSNVSGEFNAALRIELVNHQGTLATLTNTVASCGSNIISLQTEEKESNIYYIDIELTTKNRVQLANVMRKIRIMPEVQRVSRHSQSRHSKSTNV